jgi:hypothetical protein
VEPFKDDYLGTLGRDVVMQAQSQYGWYFTQ